MQAYKTKDFQKWCKKLGIKDENLWVAIKEMNTGLYEANLGAGLYKKRIAYGGMGKRGGARTILAFQLENKAFFLYGFAKNKKSTLTNNEELALKNLAKIFLDFNEEKINIAVRSGELFKVKI